MKISHISFNTTIPIDAYGINDRMGAEAELEENEDPINAMRELILFVETARNEKYPHLYRGNSQFAISEPERGITISNEPVKFEGNVTLEQIIPKCKTLQELSMYEKIIDKKQEGEEKRKLWLIYDEVYAKLSNQ